MKRFLRASAMNVLTTLLRPFCGGLGGILVLHRVMPDVERSSLPSNRALEVTPDDLRAMLAWMRDQGVEIISLDNVPGRLRQPRSPRFFAITLDDGYRDNLVHALPVFREFDAPFTVNVTNGFANRTASVWWYFVEEALHARPVLEFAFDGVDYRFSSSSTAERNDGLDAMARLIRSLGIRREELIERISLAAGVDPLAATRRLCMDWDEIRELAKDPLVIIGAHTVAHHSLNRLSEAEIQNEVEAGRDELAAQLGREIRHFAYPFGGTRAVGEREFAIVCRCGFASMLTTRVANLFASDAGRIDRLPRLTVSGNYPAVSSLRRIESGVAALLESRARRR